MNYAVGGWGGLDLIYCYIEKVLVERKQKRFDKFCFCFNNIWNDIHTYSYTHFSLYRRVSVEILRIYMKFLMNHLMPSYIEKEQLKMYRTLVLQIVGPCSRITSNFSRCLHHFIRLWCVTAHKNPRLDEHNANIYQAKY